MSVCLTKNLNTVDSKNKRENEREGKREREGERVCLFMFVFVCKSLREGKMEK